jgi:hypothetical protein
VFSKYPRCIAGSRARRAEDVGGAPSYARFLDTWGDALHDVHKDMRRWVGRKFNPECFDVGNNKQLSFAQSDDQRAPTASTMRTEPDTSVVAARISNLALYIITGCGALGPSDIIEISWSYRSAGKSRLA